MCFSMQCENQPRLFSLPLSWSFLAAKNSDKLLSAWMHSLKSNEHYVITNWWTGSAVLHSFFYNELRPYMDQKPCGGFAGGFAVGRAKTRRVGKKQQYCRKSPAKPPNSKTNGKTDARYLTNWHGRSNCMTSLLRILWIQWIANGQTFYFSVP